MPPILFGAMPCRFKKVCKCGAQTVFTHAQDRAWGVKGVAFRPVYVGHNIFQACIGQPRTTRPRLIRHQNHQKHSSQAAGAAAQ